MLSNVSPKVVTQTLTAIVGVIVMWAYTGTFNEPEIIAAIATLVQAVLGYAAPPATDVTQAEVTGLSNAKNQVNTRNA